MTTEIPQERLEGPQWTFTIRVARDTQSGVKAAAQKWGVTPTKAVARLVQIGLAAAAGILDQDKEIRAIGLTLAAVADRLDRLDKLSEVTARAAIKSAMFSRRQVKVSAGAPEVLKRLDAAIEKTIEETLK